MVKHSRKKVFTQMKLVIIDGQGGKMGRTVIEQLKKNLPDLEIYAIGTNSIATSAMLKAGADYGATGENPVIVGARTADIIIGPRNCNCRCPDGRNNSVYGYCHRTKCSLQNPDPCKPLQSLYPRMRRSQPWRIHQNGMRRNRKGGQKT